MRHRWVFAMMLAAGAAHAEEPLERARDAVQSQGKLSPLPKDAMRGVRVSRVRPLLLRGDHARARVRAMIALGAADPARATKVMQAAVARLAMLPGGQREIELLNAGILLGALPALPKDAHPTLRKALDGRTLPGGLSVVDIVALSGQAYLGLWDRAQQAHVSATTPGARREALHLIVGMWAGLTAVTLGKAPLMDAAPMGETLRSVVKRDAEHGGRDIELERRIQGIVDAMGDGISSDARFQALEALTKTPPAKNPGNG